MTSDVLVIGNSDQNHVVHAAELASAGYAVNEAHSIKEARVMLKAGIVPRSVVIDMADNTDTTALAHFMEFLENRNLSDIPVIIIGTTHDGHGAHAVLPHPVHPPHLVDHVRDALQ